MKIENLRYLTEVVDFWPMLTFLHNMLNSKINGDWIQWTNGQLLFNFQVNWMKIDNFRNLASLTFWLMVTSKIIAGWLQWPQMQIPFKFLLNRKKIEDFRYLRLLTFDHCWFWCCWGQNDWVKRSTRWPNTKISKMKWKGPGRWKDLKWYQWSLEQCEWWRRTWQRSYKPVLGIFRQTNCSWKQSVAQSGQVKYRSMCWSSASLRPLSTSTPGASVWTPPGRFLAHPHLLEMPINLLKQRGTWSAHWPPPLTTITHWENLVSRISIRNTSRMSLLYSWCSKTVQVTNVIWVSLSNRWLDTKSKRRKPRIPWRDLVPKELCLNLRSHVRVQVSNP